MRRHLLVVSEKNIKMLKTNFCHRTKRIIIGGTTITSCRSPTCITNMYVTLGLNQVHYADSYGPT